MMVEDSMGVLCRLPGNASEDVPFSWGRFRPAGFGDAPRQRQAASHRAAIVAREASSPGITSEERPPSCMTRPGAPGQGPRSSPAPWIFPGTPQVAPRPSSPVRKPRSVGPRALRPAPLPHPHPLLDDVIGQRRRGPRTGHHPVPMRHRGNIALPIPAFFRATTSAASSSASPPMARPQAAQGEAAKSRIALPSVNPPKSAATRSCPRSPRPRDHCDDDLVRHGSAPWTQTNPRSHARLLQTRPPGRFTVQGRPTSAPHRRAGPSRWSGRAAPL